MNTKHTLEEWYVNPYEHNAKCLLGIDDDWTYTDIREHLEWLINI